MRRILLFSILMNLVFITSNKATHITGGDFSVKWLNGNNFQVTLKLFRDCASGGAAFDSPINIRVFDNVTNAVVSNFSMTLLSVTPITLGDECYSPPSSICIEEGFYQTTISLANNPNGYYMAWERCCRNPGIVNVSNPNNAGMVFYVQVPDPAIQNSNPEFGSYPPEGYLCIGTTNYIDFSVTEPDGDSLAFELEDLYMGSLSTNLNPAPNSANPKPYAICTWQAPFGLGNIVGGTPPMTINPQTGIITCNPTTTGIFAFAVMIKEYRNGVKISETRREIQYYVLNCVFDDLPAIMLTDTVNIQVLTSGCFDVVVIDEDVSDTVSIFLSSNTFGQGATLVTPDPYVTTPTPLYYYYFTNSSNIPDSILLPAPDLVMGSYVGIGGVGLRYCFPTDCPDLEITGMNLDVAAFSLGCSGDTNFINRVVQIKVIPPQGIEEIVPNVFTPNGDGLNDVFRLEGTPNPCWDSIHVEIYNRWGQLIYVSDEVEFKWDGKTKAGKEVPEGTYFVILKGTFGDTDVTRQYPVTLLRTKK
ncbi:MAG: gliding motility-associated C-terminal domain-containing protein [Flavobacteriales bacterium]